ncbi:uncharacterized protein VTP21DRAFT_1310 [Calcarisporiella thermophila]|uniref:uncharacterized protein n=1 Tax=Calcarisporiella thermophila TaxID=911321 RepID=UPI0037449265
MNIEIQAVAIIGKSNGPLYIRCFTPTHPELKYHYMAHTSCDVIDERASGGTKLADTYLGLLYTMEDLAAYGYMSNTRIKFVVVCTVSDEVIRDSEMKAIFRKLHSVYINYVCNPFYMYELNDSKPIRSAKFDQSIDAICLQPRAET